MPIQWLIRRVPIEDELRSLGDHPLQIERAVSHRFGTPVNLQEGAIAVNLEVLSDLRVPEPGDISLIELSFEDPHIA
jgi:hypothetical protein